MKKIIIFFTLLILMQASSGVAESVKSVININEFQTGSLADYTGKYEIVEKRGKVAVQIDLVNGELVCTQLWDGEKLLLKHLSGDNFIMAGFDWAVKFLRDKDKKIAGIMVSGTTHWTKVKN